MTATTVDVCDEPITKADLATNLGFLCHRAKREMAVVGNAERPTPWDKRHEAINDRLDEWQTAPK